MDELRELKNEFDKFRLAAASRGVDNEAVACLDARLDATVTAMDALLQRIPDPDAPWAIVVVALGHWRQTIADWRKMMARIREREAAHRLSGES